MLFKDKLKKLRKTARLTQGQVDQLSLKPAERFQKRELVMPGRSRKQPQRAGDLMLTVSAAYLCGVSYMTYMNYQAGRALPKRETLVKIAEVFGVTVDQLIDDDIDL